ncbi:hypothetical protein [Micromonospora sp. HM5-17]|jgi:hypothetical protein|uniref:hypothetical protein n=1 Tax=Micromonospora sp. HM5-17 TaxID=2487710 RepID=UPI000F49FD34|nr:hypothetical protein [Micromonospora sp. HM5-17]ROT33016.1 hypothetical protein EF879_07680 [Micromonospora sp. HM5-17]
MFWKRAKLPEVTLDDALGDAGLVKARDLARAGDWAAVREMFAETVGDWERRALYANVLGKVDRVWLDDWLAAAPDDPGLWVLLANREADRAGRARGAGKASETSREQFADFHYFMARAAEACERAAALNPDDPTPWIQSIWTLFGHRSGAPFEKRFAELTARDPFSYLGHEAAVQYRTKKWFGSHGAMYELARSAAASAPPGSPLHALPVQAHIEYALREFFWGDNPNGAEQNLEFWNSPDVVREVEAARADWLAAGPPRHPAAPKVRGVFAFVASWGERWRPALADFRELGPVASEYPWYYRGRPAEILRACQVRAARAR